MKFLQIPDLPIRLRSARKRAELTQQNVADLGHVTIQTAQRYESGAALPSLSFLDALDANGLDVRFVLTSVSDPEMQPAPNVQHLADALELADGLMQKHSYQLSFRQRAELIVQFMMAANLASTQANRQAVSHRD